MRLSFYENLMNYYHKNHGIGDFFHDHNHVHVLILVLVHVHEFETILHSLQGMDLQLANNTLPRDCAKDVTCNSLDIPNHRRGLLLTHPSIFFHFAKQFSFKPLQTSLTKTTSLMETILSNSMPISVSSLPPVRAVPSPRKLEFSSFTPKTTLFGSRSQRKLGFRCSPRRAAVTCGGVTEIKESQFSRRRFEG
ncbi:hypothetical protein CK203_062599 [Vitis vinifera]|uniref:Uncharacterized protein n=1 Tax=Vitis vinifera TaxID=29760 RepID=A0A438FZ68_VITVI|nr:hypothetical protein CK203_062599 [Vitis vinifera]